MKTQVACPECGRSQDAGNRLTRDQIKRRLGLNRLPMSSRMYWCKCGGGTLFKGVRNVNARRVARGGSGR